jgi:cytochrome c2
MLVARLIGCWLIASALTAAAAPFVPGFERFGEQGGGALLFGELGCANCHGSANSVAARRGPVLPGLAQRIQPGWLRGFLADPQSARPGSNMPEMFSGPDDPRIEPVVHYLLSLKPAATKQRELGKDVNAERGSELFHTVGCIACHEPSPDFQPPTGRPESSEFTYASVAFPQLQAKYSLESLARFLEDPAAVRPDGRMPSFGLSPTEATDIAAHLLDFQDSDPRNATKLERFTPDPAKAAQGAEVYTQLRCAACHEEKPNIAPIPIANPGGGCLAAERGGALPFYALSDPQRTALQTPAGTPSPVHSLNCLACHTDQGTGGPDAARNHYFTGDEALGDTGRLPPPLTGIGRKLQPEWLTGVLEGKNRVRPYLLTRMPVYASQANALTAGLHDTRTLPALAEGDVEAGRKLLGTQGGVNCITCHTWGKQPSLGIQALDLSNLEQRLQPEWFRDYLLNPAGYRPGTLMPPLWPGGQSMIQDVLDGDTERQIASIWAFIAKGSGVPLGFPDMASGAFELVPKEKPIVQRAFLNGAGPYAILAGFPGGVNLAYDGETGQPARMWRGRFFDAYTTWFVRAAPFEDPLGSDVLDWPKAEANAFRGYRLEPDGSPVFLLKIAGADVSERFSSTDGALRRELTWSGDLAEPVWTHPAGAEVTEEPGGGKGKRVFVYRWKS